jgi:hypothetical protein
MLCMHAVTSVRPVRLYNQYSLRFGAGSCQVLFSAAQFAVLMWHFCGAVPGGRAQQVFLMTCTTVSELLYQLDLTHADL